jgi:hypothetical protein
MYGQGVKALGLKRLTDGTECTAELSYTFALHVAPTPVHVTPEDQTLREETTTGSCCVRCLEHFAPPARCRSRTSFDGLDAFLILQASD